MGLLRREKEEDRSNQYRGKDKSDIPQEKYRNSRNTAHRDNFSRGKELWEEGLTRNRSRDQEVVLEKEKHGTGAGIKCSILRRILLRGRGRRRQDVYFQRCRITSKYEKRESRGY